MKTWLFVFTIAVFLAGCAQDSSQAITDSAINSQFEITYNDYSKSTSAKATFRKGNGQGDLAIFNPAAKITFNDAVLDYQSGGFYLKEFSGDFKPTSTFKVVDINNKQITNSIGGNLISTSSISTDTVSVSSGFTISFLNENRNVVPLDSGETVTISFGQQSFIQDSVGKSSMTIASSYLTVNRTLSLPITLTRTKKLQKLAEDFGGGGSISIAYIIKSKDIYFK